MASPSPDGVAVVSPNNTGSPIVLGGLTTSVPNDMILVLVGTMANAPVPVVTSVSSANLSFTLRARHEDDSLSPGAAVEEWWARASGTLSSEVITVSFGSGAPAGIVVAAQAFQNVSSTKFDPNVSLPAPGGGGFPPATVAGMSTTLADDLLLYIALINNSGGSGAPTAPSGWTNFVSTNNFASAPILGFVASYLSVSSTQSSLSATATAPNGNHYAAIGDALTSDVFTVIPHSQGMIVG